jgi:CHAD domain-containing protein
MQDNVLNNYVLERLKSIERNISRYSKSCEPEYLHKLRVDIKNIRAVYSFARKVYKRNYDAAALSQLFKNAGRIREIHINIPLLASFADHPNNLIAELQTKEHTLNQEFVKSRSRYANILEEFRKTVCFPVKLAGIGKIKKYFERLQRQSDRLALGKDRDDLHKYRMKLKQMIYVYALLPKKVQKVVELDDAMTTELQEELGNWHDTYSAINLFSKENGQKLSAEHLKKLKAKETRQFNKALKYLAAKAAK